MNAEKVPVIKPGYALKGEYRCPRCGKDCTEVVRVPKTDGWMWLCRPCIRIIRIVLPKEGGNG